jgi:membrane-associated protease RseP (regulator of RpoE activity)
MKWLSKYWKAISLLDRTCKGKQTRPRAPAARTIEGACHQEGNMICSPPLRHRSLIPPATIIGRAALTRTTAHIPAAAFIRALVLASVLSGTAYVQLSSAADHDGWLGVSVQDITPSLREATGLDRGSGVLVNDIVADGAAARAGVQPKDVIIQLGAHDIRSADDLIQDLSERDAGDVLSLHVMRETGEGKFETKEIMVTLGQRPEKVLIPKSSPGSAGGASRDTDHWVPRAGPRPGQARLGVVVHPLDRDLAPYFRTEPGQGVLVLEVTDGGPAAKAGVRPGDVILRLNGITIADPGSLQRETVALRPGDSLRLDLVRMGRETRLAGIMESRILDSLPKWDQGASGHSRNAWSRGTPKQSRTESLWLHRQMERLQQQMKSLRREIDDLSRRLNRADQGGNR